MYRPISSIEILQGCDPIQSWKKIAVVKNWLNPNIEANKYSFIKPAILLKPPLPNGDLRTQTIGFVCVDDNICNSIGFFFFKEPPLTLGFHNLTATYIDGLLVELDDAFLVRFPMVVSVHTKDMY